MRCKTGTEVQFLLRILGYFAAKAREDAKNCNGIANAVDTCTMQTIGPASSSFSSAFLLTLFSLSQDFLPPWDLKVVSSGFQAIFMFT